MGKIRTSRPSPAIVIAALALVAALAGTALAGPDATTSELTKSKVKKIATKQINKLAPGLSVAGAQTADHANSADSADSAQSAQSAQSASFAENADELDGINSTSFAPFDAARTVGPMSADDPPTGGTTEATLFTAGPFTATSSCADLGTDKQQSSA